MPMIDLNIYAFLEIGYGTVMRQIPGVPGKDGGIKVEIIRSK